MTRDTIRRRCLQRALVTRDRSTRKERLRGVTGLYGRVVQEQEKEKEMGLGR